MPREVSSISAQNSMQKWQNNKRVCCYGRLASDGAGNPSKTAGRAKVLARPQNFRHQR
jgi:hypothetical protein